MKIVLHVGPFKTGSTSIQSSLAAASPALRERGVIYFAPRPIPNWAIMANYAADEKLLKSKFRQTFATKDAMRDWSRANLDALKKVGTQQDADLCIISSEHMCMITPEHAQSLAAELHETFAEVSVAYYIRDPVSLYPSGIQQKVKGGLTMADLRVPDTFKYRGRSNIETFCAAFGKDRVLVRNFDRANLTGGDVVQDFLTHLPVPGLAACVPTVMENESVPGAAVAWLLNFNETLPPPEMRRQVLKKIIASKAVAELPRLRLQDPGMQKLLRAGASAEMDWINANFLLGQIPLQIETETPSAADESSRNLDWLQDWIMGYLNPEAQAILDQAAGAQIAARTAARDTSAKVSGKERVRKMMKRAERRKAARA